MDAPSQPSRKYEKHAEPVIGAEREFLGLSDDGNEAAGLAISGGGIRSASFALGVMQALVNGGVLEHLHYLSTVSGGGYIGSSLTWFLRQGQGTYGTSEASFPFGQRQAVGAGRSAQRNDILDYIRQHGAYLTPTGPLGMASFIAVVLRAMSVSLIVYFALLTLVISGLARYGVFELLYFPRPFGYDFESHPMLLIALGLSACFALFSVLFSIFTRFAGDAEYALRTGVQQVFGYVLRMAIAAALLGTLPIVHRHLGTWVGTAWTSATTGGAALGFVEFLFRQRGGDANTQSAAGILRPAFAAVLVLYGLALGAYSVTTLVAASHNPDVQLGFVIASAAAVLIGYFVNINYLGLHRMYRDRLMELFLPDASTVKNQCWARARDADGAGIDGFCCTPAGKALLPYHIINANVVLVDSKTASYRGRGGDNFIISPLYCGSDATGFSPSTKYMKRTQADRGMTLPSAMAISGAAVNPNAGVSGRGTTRTRVVSTLLALLNLRLGYWAPNPKRSETGKAPRVPDFIDPGLRGGVLTGGLHENASLIELTDGGHFENLAVYELIRRRLRTIFVCDAGEDKYYTFDDLANLIERVRVDFGAKLDFDEKSYGLAKLKPGSAETTQAASLPNAALAARGFAIGRIRYPGDPRDAPSGILIYFKPTLTPQLSVDLYGYKQANPDFPHQSTVDQFFDEDQFEAYRELGYHLGWQWLEDEAGSAYWKPPHPSSPPAGAARPGAQPAALSASR